VRRSHWRRIQVSNLRFIFPRHQPQATAVQTAPKKQLTLFDSTCLIMGIIIGAGIFRSAGDIAGLMPNGWSVLLLWAIGGVISLFGAMAYAELATAYPHQGGDYVYLGRAYGPWSGFLFGWVQLSVVRPGDIAVMAFAFADYAKQLWDFSPDSEIAYSRITYACLATIVMTVINVLGVTQGKWTQNLLTVVKVLGLLGIVVVAVLASSAATVETAAPAKDFNLSTASLALIFVLFTFGGWNEMAYVAAEVKNPRRNIWRALILGTVMVTVVYLMVNCAYLRVLGFDDMGKSKAVAADTVSAVFPTFGTVAISVLVCISALGAVNGLVFTGARISYAVGAGNRAFQWLLGRWNSKTGTPIPALLLQCVITLILIIRLGNFEDSIIYTAAAVYTFYFFTSMATIVLRDKEPQVERPFRPRSPLYPLATFIFCGVCAFLIYSAVTYKPDVAQIAVEVALVGLPVYWITMPWRVKPEATQSADAAETTPG
jgi:basic amino acid/polyamine antiporter, APA family